MQCFTSDAAVKKSSSSSRDMIYIVYCCVVDFTAFIYYNYMHCDSVACHVGEIIGYNSRCGAACGREVLRICNVISNELQCAMKAIPFILISVKSLVS